MASIGSSTLMVIFLMKLLDVSDSLENGGFLPYGGVVKITTKFSDYTLCNGALTTYNLVLTTASCVARPLLQNSFVVRSFESVIPVAKIVYHKDYFKHMLSSGIGDIAILVLKMPMEDKPTDILNPLFLERVKSNLASPEGNTKMAKTDGSFLIAGFGYVAPETPPTEPLYTSGSYLKTSPDGKCYDLYAKHIGNVSEYNSRHFMCSYEDDPKSPSPCERDQGTPLYFVKKRCTNRVPLHGLVLAPFCAGKPTFYVRISHYKSWIIDTTEKYSDGNLPLLADSKFQ